MLRVTLSVYPDDYILAVRAAKKFLDSNKRKFLEVAYENGQTYNVTKEFDTFGPYVYVVRVK